MKAKPFTFALVCFFVALVCLAFTGCVSKEWIPANAAKVDETRATLAEVAKTLDMLGQTVAPSSAAAMQAAFVSQKAAGQAEISSAIPFQKGVSNLNEIILAVIGTAIPAVGLAVNRHYAAKRANESANEAENAACQAAILEPNEAHKYLSRRKIKGAV